MTDIYDIRIETLVNNGAGRGRLPDGRSVFVPFVAPGETVRLRLRESKPHYALADLLEVVEPAPQRITPRCPHHAISSDRASGGGRPCNGCQFQHLPYAAQLAAKSANLRDQLERIGGEPNPAVQPALASPTEWNYSDQIDFLFSAQGRLALPAHGGGEIALRECHLPKAALNALWPQFDFEAIPGLQRASLRLDASDDALLILESDDPAPPELLVEELPLSVVHLSPAGALTLAGSDYIVQEILGRPLRVSAQSPFHRHSEMAAALLQWLLAELPLTGADTVLELGCGVGEWSAFIAPRVQRLIAVEPSSSAAEDFAANLDEFDNVALYEATLAETLPALGLRPDVVVLNPPPAGMGRGELDALLRLEVPSVAYRAYDSATFARDARRLIAGGYRLQSATPCDSAPQTAQFEILGIFQR